MQQLIAYSQRAKTECIEKNIKVLILIEVISLVYHEKCLYDCVRTRARWNVRQMCNLKVIAKCCKHEPEVI